MAHPDTLTLGGEHDFIGRPAPQRRPASSPGWSTSESGAHTNQHARSSYAGAPQCLPRATGERSRFKPRCRAPPVPDSGCALPLNESGKTSPLRGYRVKTGPERNSVNLRKDKALRKGAFVMSRSNSAPLWICHICPTFRPGCRAAVLRSPAAPRPTGPSPGQGSGLPMWIAVGLRRHWDREKAVRDGFGAQRVADLARRADRMGETIALVWCWHGPIPPPRAVILNQATPIRADVFEEVETTGEGPAGRSCAYVSARPEGVSACNYSRLRDRFG